MTNVKQAQSLWDILSIEQSKNLTLPAWTDAVFPNRLHIMAEWGLRFGLQTPYMMLAKGGPLVSRIFDQMMHKQNRKEPNRSINIYSGHDSTLLSVIRLLNLTRETTKIPDYGATLAFELHCAKDDNCSQPEVRVSSHAKLKFIWNQ